MTTHVTETAAAPSELAVRHFEEMLAFETDCWDVHESLNSANPDFIVVDVRGRNAFAKGHCGGRDQHPASRDDSRADDRVSERQDVCRLLRGPTLQWSK
jgi:hypothetical protein